MIFSHPRLVARLLGINTVAGWLFGCEWRLYNLVFENVCTIKWANEMSDAFTPLHIQEYISQYLVNKGSMLPDCKRSSIEGGFGWGSGESGCSVEAVQIIYKPN